VSCNERKAGLVSESSSACRPRRDQPPIRARFITRRFFNAQNVRRWRPALQHSFQETLLFQINLRHDAPMNHSFLSHYWIGHRSGTHNAL
jgi:uncharacterized protein VirK/YbjX